MKAILFESRFIGVELSDEYRFNIYNFYYKEKCND